ncbi:MAG: nitroreductase family protein [Peptococcaceae bacterium]|jgi:nitroreductase|nr:nitroreductase family protein [Peptococcaceae bacterium]
MNEVLATIGVRRSVRRFTTDPVPVGSVKAILEAARRAPSAGNLQPWLFVVVENRRLKEGLARAAGQSFVASAPLCLAVCAEPERSARVYGQRGRDLYCYQDTAAAVQNALLAAASLGLGACWVGAFDEAVVGETLGLASGLRPVALVPVGYPAPERAGGTTRRDMGEVAVFLP